MRSWMPGMIAVALAWMPGRSWAQDLPAWDDEGFVPTVPAGDPRGSDPPAEAPEDSPASPSPAPSPEQDDVAEGPDPCLEGPVVDRDLRGCDGPLCDRPDFREALLDLADLSTGQVLTRERRTSGIQRVIGTGAFLSASIACQPVVGGVAAVLEVDWKRRIRRIDVRGNSHFRDSEVLGRAGLMPGDPLDPRDPRSREALERIREAVLKSYQEDGYQGTTVEIRSREVDKNLLDLEIRIQEGRRVKIRELSIVLRPASETSPRSPAEGCPQVRDRDLRRLSGLSIGDSLTERTIPEASRRLVRALRSLGFTRVQVKASLEQSSQGLRLEAIYDSCWQIRFHIRDRSDPGQRGYRSFGDDDLILALPFGDSGTFDLAEARLGQETIRQWLESQGYPFGEVVLEYRTARDAAGIQGPVAGRIDYYLTRNRRAEIRRILFDGVHSLPERRLREVMATRAYDFFGDSGFLFPDQLFADLDRIARLYQEEGFWQVRFPGRPGTGARRITTREGDWTVHTFVQEDRSFEVRVPPGDTEGIEVRIVVQEGPRRTIGSMLLEGVQALPTAEAERMLDLRPGSPLSPARVRDAVDRLRRWYAANGFLRTRIQVSCDAGTPDQPCNLETLEGTTADLRIRVEEGSPSTVGAVLPFGLRRTVPRVVQDQFPKPGDRNNQEQVADGVRFLNNLGIFSSVQVSTVGAEETPPRERVALVVETREAPNRFLDFAVGFETLNDSRAATLVPGIGQGISNSVSTSDRQVGGYGRSLQLGLPDILLTLEARYTDQNFLGRAKRLYLPVKYGLSFTAWDRFASFAPTWLDPHFFVRNLVFRVTPFAEYDRATTRLDQARIGGEFEVARELVPHLFGSLLWETSGLRIRDPEDPVAASWGPWRYENKVIPTITWDRLDHPVDPKNGGLIQFSVTYLNALGQGNFLKYEFLGKGFLTIRRFLTLALSARLGGSRAFGGARDLPDQERYSLGGNRGVRGFSNDGISQYLPDGSLRTTVEQVTERNPDGSPVVDPVTGQPVTTARYRKVQGGDTMLAGSLELRFPLIASLHLNGAVFYDVGALAEDFPDLNGQSFRHGAGLGIRWLIGGVVPLRLDYGFILDRRCKEVDFTTGACTRREEIGNIHFGVLYTF
ncbi:MAG TPA: POTRA domain-containing protein [Myxococcota bacterium]|nr:POTRA domain-containing protein [Myxococcota bacterium]